MFTTPMTICRATVARTIFNKVRCSGLLWSRIPPAISQKSNSRAQASGNGRSALDNREDSFIQGGLLGEEGAIICVFSQGGSKEMSCAVR